MTIAMARRLRYYKKTNVAARSIECLMRLTRKYFQPLSWSYRLLTPVDFDCQFALENIEELGCAKVKVPSLFRARRHSLLNHAQIFTA
jgi:hypothetical protein